MLEGKRAAGASPDRLSITSGGGCLILFGFPFLAVGLAIVCLTLTGQMTSGDPTSTPFLLLFGGLFSIAGACVMFGRSGVIFDRRSGTATRWWGLLIPFSKKSCSLSDMEEVLVTQEVRRSKNSTYTVYPVRINTRTDLWKIREFRDYMQARRQAEEAAKFLGLGIRDSGGGTVVVRAAGTLDDSLRDQALKSGERFEMPAPPAGCRVQYDVSGDEVVFDLPATGFRPGFLLPIILSVLVSGFFAFFFFGPLEEGWKTAGRGASFGESLFSILGLAFISLPIAIAVIGVFLGVMGREQVVASPRVLRVVRRNPLRNSVKEIPAGRVEELFRTAPRQVSAMLFSLEGVLTARSDDAALSFGGSLTSSELDWLHAMVRGLLSAPPGAGAGTSGE